MTAPGPPTRSDRPAVEPVRDAAVLVGGFVALLWILEIIDTVVGHRLDAYGVQPRSDEGLLGILFAPLLHAGFGHLISNTIPLLVLGFLIALAGIGRAIAATAIIWIVGGLGTWLIAPEGTVHIGASVLVFGYIVYLVLRGVFTRRFAQIALGLLVLVVYGGALWGVLPGQSGISWQGHLFGALGGALAAWLLTRQSGSHPVSPRPLKSRRIVGLRPRPTEGGAVEAIMLWSVPRSVSTSFERMMIARGDHEVFDEPFSRHYYYGPDRVSDRYTETLPDSSVDDIVRLIDDAAGRGPVFVKDMAYHATGQLTPERLGRWRNCFLIRDPAATIASMAAIWPDFTDEETGWDALERAADVLEGLGEDLVVVDAPLLCADPAGVVAAWCERMGLPYRPDALTWEPGLQDDWELWEEWHDSTTNSTGFAPLSPAPPPPTEPRQAQAYARALPVYERLRAQAIGA